MRNARIFSTKERARIFEQEYLRSEVAGAFDALSLAHAGAQFRRQTSMGLTRTSTVPPGRGLSASLPRHFVPGYDQPVPPGQKPFAHRSASQLS
jgi:hypothetical protein